MVDGIRPISDLQQPGGAALPEAAPAEEKKLWVKLTGMDDPMLKRIQLILTMFPGQQQMIIYCAAEKKRMGARCLIHEALVDELTELLGGENVVLK